MLPVHETEAIPHEVERHGDHDNGAISGGAIEPCPLRGTRSYSPDCAEGQFSEARIQDHA